MPRLHLEHPWVAFATDQYFKYIPAHEIAASVGPERSTALPALSQDVLLLHHQMHCRSVMPASALLLQMMKQRRFVPWVMLLEIYTVRQKNCTLVHFAIT